MTGHALVVGGTGMLRGLCVDLAARGFTVSVVARRHAALASLRQDAAARTGRPDSINPVAVDYTDIGGLAMGLRTAAIAHGPFDLAVCYIHAAAAMAPIVVADIVARPGTPTTYIHVVGSEAPDPTRADLNRDEIASNPGIAYRRVILGFIHQSGGSCWLSDDEICRGVAVAMSNAVPEQVIGVVTPWEERPRS